MNRREFLVVLTVAATAGSRAALGADETKEDDEVLDAGPLGAFEKDKVYDQFRDKGVFLIRRGDEVFALSSICTHKGCKVRAQDDQSFLCKCHKSRFDPAGKVSNGPAVKDLLRLKVKLSPDNRVLVRIAKPQPTG